MAVKTMSQKTNTGLYEFSLLWKAVIKSPLSAAILSESDIQFRTTFPLVVSNEVWFFIASKRIWDRNILERGNSYSNTSILIPLATSDKIFWTLSTGGM